MHTTTALPSARLLHVLLFALPGIAGAANTPPPELKQLVAKGESLLAYERADLNGDGRDDFVFIVEPAKRDPDARLHEEMPRTLKIAIRSANGSLKVVKQNSKLVLCEACGGAFGDPFAGLTAAARTLSVSNYGGSAWRWSDVSTFNYSRRDDTWQLVRVETASFHASKPDKQERKTYRPPRDFGKIDIADFDPEKFKGGGPR